MQSYGKKRYLCGRNEFRDMKATKILSFLLFVAMAGHAQDDVAFVADRPGYVWGAEVLAHHKLAWENGLLFENTAEARTLMLNSTILRYGIFENAELRVGADFLMKDQGFGFQGFGISPLTVGLKINCYEGEGLIPSVGVLAEFQSPHVGSKELRPSHIAPHCYLLMEEILSDRFSFCWNAGLEWDGESATPTTFLGLGVWFFPIEELGSFVETNNYLHPDGNQYLTEFGLTWMPSNKVQLALSAGLDFGDLERVNNVCFDISWMIN